jgi:hypothetical protein
LAVESSGERAERLDDLQRSFAAAHQRCRLDFGGRGALAWSGTVSGSFGWSGRDGAFHGELSTSVVAVGAQGVQVLVIVGAAFDSRLAVAYMGGVRAVRDGRELDAALLAGPVVALEDAVAYRLKLASVDSCLRLMGRVIARWVGADSARIDRHLRSRAAPSARHFLG